uniref:Uncharacterized protein n=1 Tax=Ciona savignyi TaxID=51511 RepID=H2YWK2_CIOSA
MRFEWKLQRSSEVPPFYTRPLATQRSKMSSPRPERSPLKKQRSQKAHQNTTPLITTSAQPLGQRDENVTRTTIAPSKRLCVPLFASPPKITSEAKSDLTKVPAVRLPVITLSTNIVTSPTDRVTSSDQADTPNPTKRPASRKLFNPSTPSPKRSRMARQPKITDMIPQRKLRSTTNKKLESNKTVNRSTTTIKPGQISN